MPQEEWSIAMPFFYEKKLPANSFFLRAGEVATEFGVIKKGLTRFYYVTAQGKELTKAIDCEGDLIGGYTSLLTGRPASFFIQTLEETSLFCVSWSDFLGLMQRNYHWQALARRFAEIEFIKKEAREAEFLLKSAEERYLSFLDEFPDGEKRISQITIASYLGVDAATLCRLKKRLEKR